MDNLVEDFAVRKLSKEVRTLIRKMNMHHLQPANDMDKLFRKMMEHGRMNRRDLLFLESRILLNRYCREFEEQFGEDLKTGFLFSCVNQKRLLFGAGSSFPNHFKDGLKEAEIDLIPLVKKICFFDNDISVVNDYRQFKEFPYQDELLKDNILSSLAFGLGHENDYFMGIFVVLFPYINGPTDEMSKYLREKIPVISSDLFKIRNELAIAVEEFEDEQLKKAID